MSTELPTFHPSNLGLTLLLKSLDFYKNNWDNLKTFKGNINDFSPKSGGGESLKKKGMTQLLLLLYYYTGG